MVHSSGQTKRINVKKFFSPETQSDNSKPDANTADFNFNSETKPLCPIRGAMRKSLGHKIVAQLGISVD